MQAGVSTACFYPELTERALEYLARGGVKAVEVFVNAFSELEEPYLRCLRETANAAGTRIVSLHPFTSALEPLLFFSDYDRRRQDSIEKYKRFFHAASLLEADFVVFHGGRREDTQQERYFEQYDLLARAAAGIGVTLAHENVARCVGWTPDFFRTMRAQLPDARFVLDIKQCVRAGCDPLEMLEAMDAGLAHVHISDHDAVHECLPLGCGEFNLVELIKRIYAGGYDGAVLLELYRSNYNAPDELLESYHMLENIIQTVCAKP